MATLASLTVKILGDTGHLVSQLQIAEKRSTSFTDKLSRMRGPLLAVSAAATAMAGGSVKAFADFDEAMNQSLAIMGEVSETQRTDMANAARQMALETRFSATQAAESYFFLASAGLDATASIEAMPAVAAFAQAGMFDMAQATDLLTDAQSALGLTIRDDAVANMENMVRVSDVLVKANTLANASVQQFSEALTSKAGAALRMVGKSVEEGVAVLAAFADQGIKSSEAGTQLGIVLRDLQTKAIQNKTDFAKFGVSVFDASGNMNNMADIIGDLEGALAGMSTEQAKATLLQLGFSDKSVASLQALIGLSDQIRTYEAQLRTAGGVTQVVADKQMESLKAKMDLAKSAVADAAITLGGIFAPIVIFAADKIGKFSILLNGMPKPVKLAMAAVIGLTIALTVLGLLIPPMAAGVGVLSGAWALMTGAVFAATGSTVALGASVTALNVVTGGLIIAIGALVTALIMMILHWDKTVRAFKIGVNALIWLAEQWVNAYILPINLIIKAWNVLGKIIGKQVDEIEINLGRLDTSVKKTADKVDDSTGDMAASMEGLTYDIGTEIDKIMAEMEGMETGIADVNTGVVESTEDAADELARLDRQIIDSYNYRVEGIRAAAERADRQKEVYARAHAKRLAEEERLEQEKHQAELDRLAEQREALLQQMDFFEAIQAQRVRQNTGAFIPAGFGPIDWERSGANAAANMAAAYLAASAGGPPQLPGANAPFAEVEAILERNRQQAEDAAAAQASRDAWVTSSNNPNVGGEGEGFVVQVVIDNRVVAESQGEIAMSEGAVP